MTQPINLFQNWLQTHPEHKWLSYIPLVLWAGLIFWFSSQPALPKMPTLWSEFLWKKAAHFLIFGGLYFWLWWSKKLTYGAKNPNMFNSAANSLVWLIIVGLYAISDEIHQVYVVNRNSSSTDVGIDLLGAICFALVLWHYPVWPSYFTHLSRWLIPTHNSKK